MKKKDLELKAKNILNGYPVGATISEPEEVDFLLDLFSAHHAWDLKKGEGVKNIVIGKSEYGTRTFFLNRVDGSKTDISYLQCIKGANTKLSDIKAACRASIRPEINKVQQSVNLGVDTCPVTSEVLTRENLHIDHYDLTFNELFQKWIEGKEVDALHKAINDTTAHGETTIYFSDKAIESDFVNFHNANTHLRAVSKKANLSILRK